MFLRSISLIFVLLIAGIAYGQKAADVLATASGLTFTVDSLSDEARKTYLERDASLAAAKTQFVNRWVRDALLEAEAKTRATTADALLDAELKAVPPPTEAEIKAVYDANRASFPEKSLDDIRVPITAFLKNGAQQKAVADLMEKLKAKNRFAAGKDINSPGIKPTDAVFSIGTVPFTAGQFAERFKAFIYDEQAEVYAHTIEDLDSTIFTTLITQEAKSRNIDPGDLISQEITNKLRDYSDGEREGLEEALKKRLYTKYAVKILLKEPTPVAHKVSADDDPVAGNPSAPVTVVMFSDFQCSACSATHPVLKRVLGGYGDKVRLVVRDFPLESVHPNAFKAALAANAARQQNKFFEYIEVLYKNQDDLSDASLKAFAAGLGLNQKQFELDFTSEKSAAEVRKDMADGAALGARGTPTIFVNGVKVTHLSAEGFRAAIDRALGSTAVSSK